MHNSCDNVDDVVHGNSKASTKKQHLYEIYDEETGDVLKTGISGQGLNKNGTSPRANRQLTDTTAARIVETDIPGRQAALDLELENAISLKDAGNSMKKHFKPAPWLK